MPKTLPMVCPEPNTCPYPYFDPKVHYCPLTALGPGRVEATPSECLMRRKSHNEHIEFTRQLEEAARARSR